MRIFERRVTLFVVFLLSLGVVISSVAYLPSVRPSLFAKLTHRRAPSYTDSTGYVLPSLFAGVPVDRSYSKFVHLKSRTCGLRRPPQNWSDRWERVKSALGLTSTVVHAQVQGCSACGQGLVDWHCAPDCTGTYFGGEGYPQDDVYGIYVSAGLTCYNPKDPYCPGVGQTERCACEGDLGD